MSKSLEPWKPGTLAFEPSDIIEAIRAHHPAWRAVFYSLDKQIQRISDKACNEAKANRNK